MEEDIENFVRYKLMGGKIILKQTVVPHRFDCQPDKKRASNVPVRTLPVKRARKQLVDEAIAENDNKRQQNLPLLVDEAITESDKIQQNLPFANVEDPCTSAVMNAPVCHSSVLEDVNLTSAVSAVPPQTRSVGVQARPSYRSKYITCKITNSMRNATTSPLKSVKKDSTTSPLQKYPTFQRILFPPRFPQTSSSTDTDVGSSSFVASTIEDSDFEINFPQDQKEEKLQALNVTRLLIEKKPKDYTGIPNHWFSNVINLLSTKTKISKDNLMLTLMKIKLNDPFARLGDMFGMSLCNASKIFKKTLVQIEPHLKSLIFWPSSDKIKYYLPIPFRAHYSNVQSIIDCLEIQIQKPTEPVKQALTWSDYKKCNTLKYLISCTPDGFINFISKGYGGRISDSLLVEESGYFDVLPAGCSVMADRGFKDIAKQLTEIA
ncbi:hypothetical protein PPYR_06545, partial [Photinus pyralis]